MIVRDVPNTRRVEPRNSRQRSANDPIGLYLEEIGRHPLLTPDNERELCRAIAAGREAQLQLDAAPDLPVRDRRRLQATAREGRAAFDRFVNSNLRLVVSVAKRYQSSGVPLLDLIQEGNLGLIRAVEKFDAEKGFRFSTYAVWWIRQFISRGIASTRTTVRLPSRANDELLRVRDYQMQLEQVLGRAPEIAELAEAADVTEERLLDLLRLASDPVAFSTPVGDDGAEIGDFIEDHEAHVEVEAVTGRLLPHEVDHLLSVLDDREQSILRLRHGFDGGEPRTVGEVATQIGLSRERIRQLEHRGMAKLLHPSWRGVHRLLVDDVG